MSRTEIFEKLTEVFIDVFDDEDIVLTETTTADDVEDWDSLAHITLIAEVESAFGMKFAMKEVLGMQNVGEMVSIIEREL